MNKTHILFCLCFVLTKALPAQNRVKQSINTGWEFYKGEIRNYPAVSDKSLPWEKVSIPHSWNITDVTDDVPGYYRGTAWYHKTLFVPAAWKNTDLYLYFEGANQIVEIYVNGQLAGKHTGGYTAFSFKINKFLKLQDTISANQVDIKVNNSHNENIPPLDADFSFYGGIYRDVYLMAVDRIHFTMDDMASPGMKINTKVSNAEASISVTGSINNSSAEKIKIKIVNEITNAAGQSAGTTQAELTVKPSLNNSFQQTQVIKMPHLWSPDDPYLYRVISRIYDAKTGKLLDEVSNPLGLRWFNFSGPEGFSLNGEHLKLIGACRHQDYKDLGNALPDELHVKDMELLKQMGGNFIRIAHYPQDPAVLQACDRLGILASVEIPIVNRITESAEFRANCQHMQQEMIRQNYNHPSIIIWAYMNEVMLRPRYDDLTPERKRYFERIVALAKSLDSLTRSEDPHRYTMISCNGNFDRYFDTGLAKVPQIVGWNLYYGWYEKTLQDLEGFLDRHHKMLTDKPLIITEFGADADNRLHALSPQRFDKTVEYQLLYHKHYLNVIQKIPYVTGGTLWNLVDFIAEARQEATPHINTKGLLTNKREPKETYFFYQANLSKVPMVHIGGDNWKMRTGLANRQSQCEQEINVYSNGQTVSLYHNGKLVNQAKVEGGVARFTVPFINGENQLKAVAEVNGNTIEDYSKINFELQPVNLQSAPFNGINVSLGDQRYFTDEVLHQLWVPEQAYIPGSWGYVGGEIFKVPGNVPYGTSKDIFGTDNDAVYQTQRVGLTAFKLDVPDGVYEVILHFAELITPTTEKALIYNLNDQAQKGGVSNRAFDVLVNGSVIIKQLSTQNYLSPQQAYVAKTTVTVQHNNGIEVSMKAISGQTILNGIQVKRVY